MSSVSHFGKGAIKTPEAVSATRYKLAAVPPATIDWSKPYRVEKNFTVPQRNQNGSSSCTAQATSYYTEALQYLDHAENEEYSARYIYSQTHQPDGGAYIWQAMSIPVKFGAASIQSVPEAPESEAIMTDTSLNSKAVLKTRAEKYAQISSHDMNALATIIQQYGGFVTGFNGNDTMAQNAVLTIPDHVDWGHCVWVCGYKTLADGRKVLQFKNSWGNWGDNGYGYFTEDFVKSGYMFDAYVFADVIDLDNNMTEKEVKGLQALEGYSDPAGVSYWTGKQLADYLAARLPDKIKTLQAAQ